jgi:hypothetical protein
LERFDVNVIDGKMEKTKMTRMMTLNIAHAAFPSRSFFSSPGTFFLLFLAVVNTQSETARGDGQSSMSAAAKLPITGDQALALMKNTQVPSHYMSLLGHFCWNTSKFGNSFFVLTHRI